MPDTELAQELHALSGWEYDQDGSYSLGYLLHKLRAEAERYADWGDGYIGVAAHRTGWRAWWGHPKHDSARQFEAGADTPEDAMVKLVMILFRARMFMLS